MSKNRLPKNGTKLRAPRSSEICATEPSSHSTTTSANMWGWAKKRRAAVLLQVSRSRLTVERCNGLRRSLTKNLLQLGFIRARCLSHASMALSSSPRSGCVVDNPCFNRTTCNTRLCVSTWSSFNRQASDTLNPCRNIRSKRQRSRASLRVPLVAAISLPTSSPVRWLRPALLLAAFLFLAVFCCPGRFIFLSIITNLKTLKNPCKTPSRFLHYRQMVTKCRELMDGPFSKRHQTFTLPLKYPE